MSYATETRSAGASLANRFSAFRAALADRYAKYKVYRATLAELSALSDRELADLGIARSSIQSIATDAAEMSR